MHYGGCVGRASVGSLVVRVTRRPPLPGPGPGPSAGLWTGIEAPCGLFGGGGDAAAGWARRSAWTGLGTLSTRASRPLYSALGETNQSSHRAGPCDLVRSNRLETASPHGRGRVERHGHQGPNGGVYEVDHLPSSCKYAHVSVCVCTLTYTKHINKYMYTHTHILQVSMQVVYTHTYILVYINNSQKWGGSCVGMCVVCMRVYERVRVRASVHLSSP